MGRLLILWIIFLSLESCSKGGNVKMVYESMPIPSGSDSVRSEPLPVDLSGLTGNYLKSTYTDSLLDLKSHRAGLNELANKNVFLMIHREISERLVEKHQHFFLSKPAYQLLYCATGDLFQNGNEDAAFIVFDKVEIRISILVRRSSIEVPLYFNELGLQQLGMPDL